VKSTERGAHSNAYRSRYVDRAAHDLTVCILNLLEQGLHPVEVSLSLVSQGNVSSAAIKKCDAQAVLDRSDRFADCRL
jgi:uncharacterized protein YejL (UPF0352 family)